MSVSSWLESLPAATPVGADELDHLRHDLDASVRRCLDDAEGHLDPQLQPIRLPKGRLADLERCPRSALARFGDDTPTPAGPAVLRGIALDHFVAHQLVAGRVREPAADLVSMLGVSADWDSLAVLDDMDHDAVAELVDPLAAAVAADWAGIDAGWVPRTQSRATLLLAEGRCVCSGQVDVELGGPGTGRPGVVVEVKSGAVAAAHPHEVYLYALLVALRDRAAPSIVARWYPGAAPTGLPVTVGVLEAAAARLVAAAGEWVELLCGAEPAERPGGWCAWCPDRGVCPSAREADHGG